jgi:hypothetical protein
VKLKTITISDLHGKSNWRDINPDNYDKIIFLGDYMDAPYRKIGDVKSGDALNDRVLVDEKRGRTHAELLYNLNGIINFKDEYPDKVVLLVGNHELPYIYYLRNKSLYNQVMCSGHRYTMAPQVSIMINDNFNKFQMMYQIKNVLWSHAGLTQEAYNAYFKSRIGDRFDILVEEINKLFILNDLDLHIIPEIRGGYHKHGSITWADRREWNAKTYKLPFMQIVGHTPCHDILYLYEDGTMTNDILDKNPIVIFTDILDKKIKFFEYEIEV